MTEKKAKTSSCNREKSTDLKDLSKSRKLWRRTIRDIASTGCSTEYSDDILVTIQKVAVCSSLRLLKPKCTIESRAKRSSINLIRTHIQFSCLSPQCWNKFYPMSSTEFHCDIENIEWKTIVFHRRWNLLLETTSNKIRPHKGVKAFANSDVMYFFTSAHRWRSIQDDVRLCLDDDLKKAQDHSQRQA
ncbi:hypothetical protein Tco_0671137 [Tanacetum coccineum]